MRSIIACAAGGDGAERRSAAKASDAAATAVKHHGEEPIGHLVAHRAGKIIRLPIADIACIVVEDTITRALTAEGRFRLRQGLGQREERLTCPPFFRVSRAAMVNLGWIDHLAPLFSGTYSAFLKEPVGL